MLKEEENMIGLQFISFQLGTTLMLAQLTNEMLEDMKTTIECILELRKGNKKNVSKTNSKSK